MQAETFWQSPKKRTDLESELGHLGGEEISEGPQILHPLEMQ